MNHEALLKLAKVFGHEKGKLVDVKTNKTNNPNRENMCKDLE